MITIKPLEDRILVKLRRDEEKKVGDTVITLVQSDKKRVQPESAVFIVMATGPSVSEEIKPGMLILARSDAGITLPVNTTNGDNHRLYRLMEAPEIWSIVEEDTQIASLQDVLPEKVVI